MAVTLEVLLKTMVKHGASDLHIRSGARACLRIDGKIKPVDNSEMTAQEVYDAASSCMTDRAKKIFQDKRNADFSLENASYGRFRFNVYQQRNKICISIRHIPFDIPSFEQLNLPVKTMERFAMSKRGIVMITGTAGSGKSTTIAALIDYINRNEERHIITIEDPIEFLHSDKRSIISQREVGIDTESFQDGLVSALRQDPDVILLGEMRDYETARAAITAAETGHLVFSTVHTVNTAQTVSRIIDMFPPHQQNQVRLQLSDSIRGVVSQRLLPLKGASGRIPALEVMYASMHIRKLIADNKLDDITGAMEKGEYYGMKTFNQSLVELYKKDLVSLEDILASASNPDDVLLSVRGIESKTKL